MFSCLCTPRFSNVCVCMSMSMYMCEGDSMVSFCDAKTESQTHSDDEIHEDESEERLQPVCIWEDSLVCVRADALFSDQKCVFVCVCVCVCVCVYAYV